MRAIVNGVLYDTEKSKKINELPIGIGYDIYMTQNGNIFAVEKYNETFYDAEQIRKSLERKPEYVDIYIQIFGMPEEA